MQKLTPEHILDFDTYSAKRADMRAEMIQLKAKRRLFVGPYATFHFESFKTLWYQIQEMLHIEKGGAEQLEDELEAYAPLVPNGQELVSTLMFEIEDKHKREAVLGQLGGVEHKVFIKIGDDKIYSIPEQDVERSIEGGRTSSVHFLHFPFSKAQIEAFKKADTEIILGFDHPHYAHMTVLSEDNLQTLRTDFED